MQYTQHCSAQAPTEVLIFLNKYFDFILGKPRQIALFSDVRTLYVVCLIVQVSDVYGDDAREIN